MLWRMVLRGNQRPASGSAWVLMWVTILNEFSIHIQNPSLEVEEANGMSFKFFTFGTRKLKTWGCEITCQRQYHMAFLCGKTQSNNLIFLTPNTPFTLQRPFVLGGRMEASHQCDPNFLLE